MKPESQFNRSVDGSASKTSTLNFDSDQNSALDNLFNPSIGSILLKGQPGSGKTTLAIELLAKQGKGTYVSTRVSLDLLSKHNPKLHRLIEEGKVQELYSQDNEQISSKIGFADSRLGTANGLLQSVLELSMSIKEKKEAPHQLVVLDSWDAIGGMMDPIERKKFERSLLAIAAANKLQLVFVSETSVLTDSDYMVDAILELEDEVLDGRRIRKLVWKKVRGQEISQRSQLYTLHNGSFTIFSTNPLTLPRNQTKEFPAIPHYASKFSTGSNDIDTRLFHGGVEHGSIISLELGPTVSITTQWPLGLSIALNFIANGDCSTFFPPFEIDPIISKKTLENHLSQVRKLDDSLRIVHATRSTENDPCFIDARGKPIEEIFRKSMDEVSYMKNKLRNSSSKSTERHCFHYVTMDAAENLFGTVKPKSAMQEFERIVKMDGDLALLVITGESELGQMTKKSSDIHLKLVMIEGIPVLYAEKPPSPHLFQLNYDFTIGYPKVSLTPIV